MLTKDEITQILREQLPYLTTTYGVQRIGLFGSYAKGTSTATSDVDLIVEFSHPIGFRFIELTEYLEQLFGTRVDVLTPVGIQGIRIERIARSIQESVIYA